MAAGLLILFALLPAQGEEGAAPAAQLTKLPVLTHYVEAPYPAAALSEQREGDVTLAIDVDTSGLVERVEILEASSPELAMPAMEAACGFQFEPAEAGELGRVPVRITYRYGFVLRPALAGGAVKTASTATASAAVEPPATRQGERPINFYGVVKEGGKRVPVPFAWVEVSIATTATVTRTSTEADVDGRFAFRGLPAGNHVVTIRAPYFARSDTKEEIRPGEAVEALYYLERVENDPLKVTVRDRIVAPKKEVARRTLKFEEIIRLPGTQGDAIRVIQNLPGVARTPFGLGLLVVRGAPPTDTGVYLDGHRLPLLFHFGGIGGVTSVINSRMLDTIDFSPGGFGPHQGRVSAGIVELNTRYALTDRVHGEAVVDLAGASAFIEGPVSDDPNDGAFVLALRRSYVDGVLAGILSLVDADAVLAPRYYDYQLRYDKPLGSNKRMLSMLFYGSDDELILLGSTTQASGTPDGAQSRTYFHRFNPSFTYRPDSGTMLRISPIIGIDHTNTQTTGDPSGNNPRLEIKNYNAGMRIDGLATLGEGMKLRSGGDILYFDFTTDSVLPALPATKDFPSPLPTDAPLRADKANIPAVIGSLYAELELELGRFTFWPGLRLELYDFKAEESPLIDPRLVEGRTVLGIDPRFTTRYEAADWLSLKAQAGLYGQPPLPTQYYLNADLPLTTTQQYSAGFDWTIFDTLSLDLQGFYRFTDDVARFTGNTEVVDGKVRVVGFTPDAVRRAYGLEALLKLEKTEVFGREVFGWIAYTLSRSEFRQGEDGEWRTNFFFDQTHNLNVLASCEIFYNWFLSARFRFVTGGGLPATQARWYDADRDQYGRTVSQGLRRTPPFHQLDVRIDKKWDFDEWSIEVYLDVQNVYNASNTELFVPTFDFKNELAIPSFPIFPILGLKGVF